MRIFKWFVLILFVLLGVSRLYVYFTYHSLTEDISYLKEISDFNTPVKLDFISIKKQDHPYSCGPATIAMTYDYLIDSISEKEIIEKNGLTDRKKGMLPHIFSQYLAQSLKSYKITHQYNLKDGELLQKIHHQLSNGLPVPIFFSTINHFEPTTFDTHYSMIVGLNLKTMKVVIANAYGFEETIAVDEFLDKMKFTNFKNKPLLFNVALQFGYIKYSNIYMLSHK